jgi:hypothetical protein
MDEFNPNAQVSPDAMANDPAAVYEAPGLEGIPSEQGMEEQPDYAAMLEQERQAREEAERRAQQTEQQLSGWQAQQQQMMFQQAQQAWQQREQQLIEGTKDYDENTRVAIMRQFYNEQINQLAQAGQQAVQMVSVQAYTQDVLRRYGLSDDDRILLGNNPNQIEQAAARLRAERDQHRSLVEQIERDRRARQAQETVQAGVNRIGGVGGRPVPAQGEYEKGSPEHLRALLRG